ncbi:hypothetical protein PC116_g28495 [Phytophthora cactorum]|uniref:Uncharacterized protein n=1 Tax=Phytophthora cactorum TaxID=29920 RepID=A0A8T0Y6C9_9STRA|nr:hypothetical protein Pcac1_g14635 [Phytophthora cactorum]KAG2791790.1 hypothetical protein PC111_g23756 [Phytophthora cactorum]KAG2792210.1 hypothetical protein PC112_g23949 [Phytophthora cactorum]KAG2810513.1 hypothetical protein PC113_g23756 [Phytophthora cactorum]KAG2957544.1 hypothetical protein PC118_g23968 [Phytophthora cactorum]
MSSPLPTATWASPSAARVRSRPSNLHAAVRASPSFPLSRRDASTPRRTSVERVTRPVVQSWTTQATQTEVDRAADAEMSSVQRLHPGSGIRLGPFGDVGAMTAETVDFLIRVLEDRKQELLVSGEDTDLRVKASYAASEDEEATSEEGLSSPASKVTRFQLDKASNGGAGVTELVRSDSYERLLQLEGDLEARHNKIMNEGLLETSDRNSY